MDHLRLPFISVISLQVALDSRLHGSLCVSTRTGCEIANSDFRIRGDSV